MGVSADMGKTRTYKKSQFPSIGGGQRLAFIRLREGPLLMASFAGSDDEGRPIRPVMVRFIMSKTNAEPRGYLSVCQARNSPIHLITSWNHNAFNLEWFETPAPAVPG